MLQNQLLQSLDSIPPLTKSKMLRRLQLGLKADVPVEGGSQLVLQLANFLFRCKIMQDDQVGAVIDWTWEHAVSAGNSLEKINIADSKAIVPSYRIAIMDRRFVTFTGLSTYLDILKGDVIDKLPSAPMETVTYNVTLLFLTPN